MKIANIPSPYGNAHNNPKKIVWHAISEIIDDHGTFYYALDYLTHLGISAHRFVTPSGVIIKCREDYQGAYHAKGHNKNSLGVEVMVPGCNPYPDFLKVMRKPYMTHIQKVATYELLQFWCREHGLTRSDIYRHSELSPDRKFDPGTGVNWAQLERAYREENETIL